MNRSLSVDVDLSPISVLVIDDSRYARSFIRSALQSFGVRNVREAADGPAGVQMLRDQAVDVVLVDHEMEPMDGIGFTRFVRSGEAVTCVDVPIIMVSGSSEMEVVVEARLAGVNEFLVKPISADSLFRRLRNVLVNPRPFVNSAGYVGPCRRTIDRKVPEEEDRRFAPPLPRPRPRIAPPAQSARPAASRLPAQPQGGEKTSRKRFRAGSVIFNEGERGNEAYVIESGRVGIYKGAGNMRVQLGVLGHNGVFGEMALIDDEPRMASAMAEEDTVCLVIPAAALKMQVKRTPDLVILVLETLLNNIRKMGRELVQVRAAIDYTRKTGTGGG